MKIKKFTAALTACLVLGTATLYAAEQKPTELSADVLVYDMEDATMTAQGSVRMVQDGAVVTGQSARYNVNTKQGVVSGGVHLVKEDLDVRAAQVDVKSQTHLTATGGVVATKGDRVLTGPLLDYYSDREYALIPSDAKAAMPEGTITANRMEAFMKENHIIATGAVHIVSEPRDLDATGDRADYFGQERGKVILSGNAVAVQGSNTLRGKTLTLYLAQDQKGIQ